MQNQTILLPASKELLAAISSTRFNLHPVYRKIEPFSYLLKTTSLHKYQMFQIRTRLPDTLGSYDNDSHLNGVLARFIRHVWCCWEREVRLRKN